MRVEREGEYEDDICGKEGKGRDMSTMIMGGESKGESKGKRSWEINRKELEEGQLC